MSLNTTLTELSTMFNQLATGRLTPEQQALFFEKIALQFEQLRTDLAAQGPWQNPTGAVSRATFDPATVTLQELAKRVAAIILDDITTGIKGT